MQIEFDNIQKIEYFHTTVDEDEVEQSFYPDEDEETSDKSTTILMYLKRPALFFI